MHPAMGGVPTRSRRVPLWKEPALTASFLAAVLLAIVARFLDLTDDDLAILGPVALIVAGVVIRTRRLQPGDGGWTHRR